MNIILKDINIIKPLNHIQVRLILFKLWPELNPNTTLSIKNICPSLPKYWVRFKLGGVNLSKLQPYFFNIKL